MTKVLELSEKYRTDAKIRDIYKLGKTLGTGGFSVVKLAEDRRTGALRGPSFPYQYHAQNHLLSLYQ